MIVAFCILATFLIRFSSVTTLTDLMSVVIGILAVAAMMVLISGGIDVFTAIAVFAGPDHGTHLGSCRHAVVLHFCNLH